MDVEVVEKVHYNMFFIMEYWRITFKTKLVEYDSEQVP